MGTRWGMGVGVWVLDRVSLLFRCLMSPLVAVELLILAYIFADRSSAGQ